ncbi:MAG: hypothetical protein ACLPTZ_08970 [Beijerinckiaceae bacterium]
MPADINGILLTALVGAAAAYAHQLWKYSKDSYHARVDEACDLIFDIADSGSEYWSMTKDEKVREKLEILEVQIDGRLKRLQFLRLMLQSRLGFLEREVLTERTANFEEALTGGTFASQKREADLQRAKTIYVAASDLVAHVRTAAARGNRLWLIVFRHIEPYFPYRRPTTASRRFEERLWLSTFFLLLTIGGAAVFIAVWKFVNSLLS